MSEQSNILLEAGTNELEVLVCGIAGTQYGVNVAKVREVIKSVKTTHIPRAHPALVGTFLLRNSVIALIDLYRYFDLKTAPPPHEERSIIVMEFNDVRIGFLVDTLDRIHRVSWTSMTPAPTIDAQTDTPITSICKIGEKIVLMIDFEKVVFDISGKDLFGDSAVQIDRTRQRRRVHILLAEDSAMMRKLIADNIAGAGYTSIAAVQDGQSAWELLEAQARGETATRFDLVVTDIEMPQLDGLALTRRIKDHPELRAVPVVVFSSLVSPDNLKEIAAVKADAQITKPELARLVQLLDELLDKGDVPAAPAPTADAPAEALVAV